MMCPARVHRNFCAQCGSNLRNSCAPVVDPRLRRRAGGATILSVVTRVNVNQGGPLLAPVGGWQASERGVAARRRCRSPVHIARLEVSAELLPKRCGRTAHRVASCAHVMVTRCARTPASSAGSVSSASDARSAANSRSCRSAAASNPDAAPLQSGLAAVQFAPVGACSIDSLRLLRQDGSRGGPTASRARPPERVAPAQAPARSVRI